MIFNYTNEEFIDKTQILLNKLSKKGIWNKDTLIVGLDKSVRPLAYTIRKLSEKEGKETPDIRFFNYSWRDYSTVINPKEKIVNHLKKSVNPKKLEKYKNILILDEYSYTGQTLDNTEEILRRYLSSNKNMPKFYIAAIASSLDWDKLIYVDQKGNSTKAFPDDTGLEEWRRNDDSIPRLKMNPSIRSRFLRTRKGLSEDINKYLTERHLVESNAKNNLEKVVRGVSIIAILGGFVIGLRSITGNVIGNVSSNFSNALYILLIILGIIGFILTRRK